MARSLNLFLSVCTKKADENGDGSDGGGGVGGAGGVGVGGGDGWLLL